MRKDDQPPTRPSVRKAVLEYVAKDDAMNSHSNISSNTSNPFTPPTSNPPASHSNHSSRHISTPNISTNNDSNNYRPRSPDLSSYRQQPPRLPSFDATHSAFPAGYNFSPRGSYDASPYFSPQTPSVSTPSYFSQQPHLPQQTYSPQALGPSQVQSYTSESQYAPPSHVEHLPPAFPANSDNNMPRRRQTQDDEDDYAPESSTQPGGKPSKKRKSDPAPAPGRDGPGPSRGIEVKTKFPVARIKRIMQADEDVGKVAQATPTAVSKALELFMIQLVTRAAAEAKDRSSKRVTAAHLKQAVLNDNKFDFLVDIVTKVADPTEKKARAKSEDSAEGSSEAPVKRKRTGVTSRMKNLTADDDDDD